MHPIYSLDNTVNTFFETQPTVTRRHCDELAVALVGEPVSPTPIQGAFSYTVIAGVKQSKIVQFRAQISLLDIEALSLARAIHGDLWRVVHATDILGNRRRFLYTRWTGCPELPILKRGVLMVTPLNRH
jgi:hypothetical protein